MRSNCLTQSKFTIRKKQRSRVHSKAHGGMQEVADGRKSNAAPAIVTAADLDNVCDIGDLIKAHLEDIFVLSLDRGYKTLATNLKKILPD